MRGLRSRRQSFERHEGVKVYEATCGKIRDCGNNWYGTPHRACGQANDIIFIAVSLVTHAAELVVATELVAGGGCYWAR
jgi:hypothetical protein